MAVTGKVAAALGAMLLAALLVACSGEDGGGGTDQAGGVSGQVTVFAAASLAGAFNDMAEAFEAEYPDVEVEFNFGGSPTLRTQIEQGARADVFASANVEQMELAKAGDVVEGPASTFARNSLVVIAPADNPGRLEGPGDLAREGLKLVVANEDVPVGAYMREMLTAMEDSGEFGDDFRQRVLENTVSLESNVKQVVAKVELGEADAGIVYGTDVTPDVASSLRRVEVPDEYNVIASYPIALVKDRGNDAAARAFIDFVLSEAGQGILQKYGFLSAG